MRGHATQSGGWHIRGYLRRLGEHYHGGLGVGTTGVSARMTGAGVTTVTWVDTGGTGVGVLVGTGVGLLLGGFVGVLVGTGVGLFGGFVGVLVGMLVGTGVSWAHYVRRVGGCRRHRWRLTGLVPVRRA